MEIKKNDWVATLFFNQDKSLQELADLGFTVSNSDIKDASYYKSKPEIQQAFVNDKGEFDNVKFNNFYNSAIQLYNDEDVKSLQTDLLNSYEYDPDDLLAPIGSKTYHKPTEIVHYANPMRQSRGIKNLNQMGDPTMSEREVAQTNKIFNPETDEFENETPNDLNLWDMVTGKSLVMASWDEDGYHEVNGRMIPHRKGELKYNEEGDPYYEYLNGRSLAGKDMLHASDILTVDGSNWNKYDFFDSDGLDKSASGVIAKTLAKIAPSFIPYVGGFYAFTGAAIELGKLLPELYKSIEGIVTNDSSNNEIANSVGAWFHRFDSSASDKSRNKPLSFENIGNMVSSSSLQLIQQRLISKIPAMINSGKYTENTIKWGRALSLSYMAGTSSTDTFEAFKEAGTSDRVAGLGAIASMMAMKKLMDNDYFRDFWYKGTPLARSEFKNAIKSAANEVQKSIDVGTITKSTKNQKKFIDKTIDTIVNTFNRITSKAIISSALNEGIEETAEEVSFDTIKGIASALNGLGLLDKNSDYDFGFSFKSMISKYATSFIGGAIGGATFHLHDSFQNFINGTTEDVAKKEGFQELIYLIRNNRTGELKRELSRWHQNGKLGSTNLSGVDGTFDKNDENWGFVYSAAKEGESQNDIIYKQISNIIDRVESILDEENLKFTDEQLSEFKIVNELEHMSDDEASIALKAHISNQISKKLEDSDGILSGIFQDWNTLSNSLVSTKIQIEEFLKPEETSAKTPSDIDAHIAAKRKSSEYKYLNEKLKSLRERRDSLIKGERHSYYIGQLNFALQPKLAEVFGAIVGKDQFSLNKTGKKYNELIDSDKAIIDELYAEYNKQEKKDVFKAYDIFYNLTKMYHDDLNNTARKLFDYTKLFAGGQTVFDNTIFQKRIELESINSDLDNELKNEIKDEEKIKILNERKTQLEKEISEIENYAEIQTSRSLTQSSQDILQRSFKSIPFEIASVNYINWLNTLKDSGGFIEPEDIELNRIRNTLVKHYSEVIDKLSLMIEDESIFSLIDSVKYSFINNLKTIQGSILKGDFLYAADMIDMVEELSDLENGYIGEEDSIELFESLRNFINPKFQTSSGIISYSSFLSEIGNIRSNLDLSPIYQLLNKLLSDINPKLTGIINTIVDDLKGLSTSSNVEDYIIKTPNAVSNLETILKTIPIIYALMSKNDIIPSEEEVGLDDNTERVLTREINAIYNKIHRLFEIAKNNGIQKLLEQDKIKLNMRTKFADILVNKDSTITKNLSKHFDFDLEKIISDLELDRFEPDLDNYDEYERKLIKLENSIYQAIRNSGKTKKDTVEILMSLFNENEFVRRTPTKMTKDPNEKISDYDKFVYLLGIVANPSSNFYNKYKSILPSLNIAPIFTQEYIIKNIYSLAKDVELLNLALNKISEIHKKEEDKFLSSKDPLYNALTIISGGAGTGKTAGVDKVLYELLKDDSDIILAAPKKQQVENLENNIGYKGHSITLDELLNEISGKDITTSDYTADENNKLYINDDVKISDKNIFGTKKNRVIFIDEYSLINSAKLQLIHKWAYKNNVMVIYSGDYKQTKDYVIINNDEKKNIVCFTGIEDWTALFLPELDSSIRAGSIAKAENYSLLNRILTKCYDYYYQNPDKNVSEISSYLNDILKSEDIILKYFNDGDSFSGGEKIVSESEIDKELNIISSKTDDYIIVGDATSKYKNHPKFVLRSNVQGSEADYVILDFEWKKDSIGNDRGIFPILIELYALTQRSRKGTIIRNDEGLNRLNVYDKNDPLSSTPLVMSNNQIKKSRENRINSLNSMNIEDVELIDFYKDSDDQYQEEPEEHSASSHFNNNDNNAETNDEDDVENNDDVVDENENFNKQTNTPNVLPISKVRRQVNNKTNKIIASSIDDINIFSNINNNRGRIFANEDKCKKIFSLLSAWFKYGYYKSDDTTLLRKKINYRDFNEFLYNAIFSIDIRGGYICGIIKKGNDELIVPLFEKPDSIYTKFEINVNEYSEISSIKSGKYINITEDGIINNVFGDSFSLFSQPIILHVDGANVENISQSKRKNDRNFVIRNEGKTFIVVSSNPFASDNDFIDFLHRGEISVKPGEKSLVTREDPRFKVLGANIHATSKDSFGNVLPKTSPAKPYGEPFDVVSKETMWSMIRELYYHNKSMAKAILDTFFKHRGKSKILLKPINKWRELSSTDKQNIYNEECKTLEELYELLDKGDIKDIKYFNIIDFNSNTGMYYTKKTSDLCIAFNNHDGCINSLLNTEFFNQGIKINDFITYGGKVSDDSVFYYISKKHDLEYSLDIDSLSEPTFELIPINDEIEDVYLAEEDESSPEEISKDVETTDIKRNIGNITDEKDITEELLPFVEIQNFKSQLYSNYKLFLLTLPDGNVRFSITDEYGQEMISDIQNEILKKYYKSNTTDNVFSMIISLITSSDDSIKLSILEALFNMSDEIKEDIDNLNLC